LANALETAGRLEEAQRAYQTLLANTANERLRRLQERIR
jgi:rubrerythrin